MGVVGFIKKRWGAHNQRLLDDELYAEKLAAEPGGGVASGEGVADGSSTDIAATASQAGLGSGGGGPTGPAQ